PAKTIGAPNRPTSSTCTSYPCQNGDMVTSYSGSTESPYGPPALTYRCRVRRSTPMASQALSQPAESYRQLAATRSGRRSDNDQPSSDSFFRTYVKSPA